ncbi:hypothetical protein SAMN05428988_5323 [Chitinophaga sp. YR573]|uniref:hypothetical protein n=1 Tax=Chitinophaga sp. YR573 TaxID=1881040 RepID=UPI0008C771C3|nr:hypothetical protein [Chitinophaga sp. YR573]SEW40557.1 hypothetical protein SAMN05428988_5323 [Chitinophaga sp. YR573]
MLQRLLIKAITGIVLASCIINLNAYNYGSAVVYIEATSENGDMRKIYKDLRAQLSFKMIQNVSSIDTTDNSITLTFFVYNDIILERCEEVLHFMKKNRDYSRIDYYIVY